jgi:hypothetical protein
MRWTTTDNISREERIYLSTTPPATRRHITTDSCRKSSSLPSALFLLSSLAERAQAQARGELRGELKGWRSQASTMLGGEHDHNTFAHDISRRDNGQDTVVATRYTTHHTSCCWGDSTGRTVRTSERAFTSGRHKRQQRARARAGRRGCRGAGHQTTEWRYSSASGRPNSKRHRPCVCTRHSAPRPRARISICAGPTVRRRSRRRSILSLAHRCVSGAHTCAPPRSRAGLTETTRKHYVKAPAAYARAEHRGHEIARADSRAELQRPTLHQWLVVTAATSDAKDSGGCRMAEWASPFVQKIATASKWASRLRPPA